MRKSSKLSKLSGASESNILCGSGAPGKLSKILVLILIMCQAVFFTACGTISGQNMDADSSQAELPRPATDAGSEFGVDVNINMKTIDNYLDRDDVVYRDVRMLIDPANYGEIGGEADLTATIKGFKVVPYPYIATLQELPVEGAYTGEALFDVKWNTDGSVGTVSPNYEESLMVLEELFPKDKAIFLMCGGGGYANMTKLLLTFLGWDEEKLYNIGANWTYDGKNKLELVVYPEAADGNRIYASWRADYAYWDFDKLNKLG